MQSNGKKTLKSKVQEYICALIRENEMQEGDKLPPQREIARRLDVSQRVAEVAMRELENDNIIHRFVGRGSFVANSEKVHAYKMLSKVLLVIPNYTNPIFSLFQETLERKFFEHGILVESILTHFMHDDTMFKRICEQEWGGIVGEMPERVINFARSRKIPLVRLVSTLDRRRKYNQLIKDPRAAGFKMADMLINKAHQHIVCAGSASEQFDAIEEKFKGSDVKCSTIIEDAPLGDFPDYQAIGRHLVDEILALPDQPTAIVFSNDARALGGMRALREAGFAIPEDFSIVGFDNIPGADLFHPALTTVELGYVAGAEMAVKMIFQRKLDETYMLPQKLIIRESTRPHQIKAP
ncbi:MAG: LacI family transcriptional regulator [Victivallaceae bacterium]|nr:LacI family transcriptional regulator [Victivallaceae bacterium]